MLAIIVVEKFLKIKNKTILKIDLLAKLILKSHEKFNIQVTKVERRRNPSASKKRLLKTTN